MKANYKPRVKIPGVMDRQLSRREAELLGEMWEDVERKWAIERDRIMDVALGTVLVALHRRYGYGRRVLRAIWEDTIRLRAGLRTSLRDIGSGEGYELQETGKNIEDTAIRMELRDIGVDIKAWEDGVVYDQVSGEVRFTDGDGGGVVPVG